MIDPRIQQPIPGAVRPQQMQPSPGVMPVNPMATGMPQMQPLQNPGQPQQMGTPVGIPQVGGVNSGEMGMPWAQRFQG